MSARKKPSTADYNEMMRLRAAGMRLTTIAERFDVSFNEVKFLTVHDPEGDRSRFRPRASSRFRSPDEARVFRRFPVDRHKPGGYE